MKKRIIRTMLIFFTLLLSISLFNLVYADSDSWLEPARNFKPIGNITYLGENVLSELASLVEVAGTGIIAIATVVIGVKYVLGSVAEKSSAKENLITLLVACLFFFGWSNIRGVLIRGITFSDSGVVTNMESNMGIDPIDMSNGAEGAFQNVFGIVLIIAQMIAVLATAYMGVKYVFGGADNKAKLKEKSVGYIIGIIMIFTSLNFIKFVSEAINGMF